MEGHQQPYRFAGPASRAVSRCPTPRGGLGSRVTAGRDTAFIFRLWRRIGHPVHFRAAAVAPLVRSHFGAGCKAHRMPAPARAWAITARARRGSLDARALYQDNAKQAVRHRGRSHERFHPPSALRGPPSDHAGGKCARWPQDDSHRCRRSGLREWGFVSSRLADARGESRRFARLMGSGGLRVRPGLELQLAPSSSRGYGGGKPFSCHPPTGGSGGPHSWRVGFCSLKG